MKLAKERLEESLFILHPVLRTPLLKLHDLSVQAENFNLYDVNGNCDVNETLPKNMPKRCPRGEGRCMEGIHPLDILQHYFEMRELGVQPLLHLQKPGDIFCFPKHWFHGTINLEPNVVVSVKLMDFY